MLWTTKKLSYFVMAALLLTSSAHAAENTHKNFIKDSVIAGAVGTAAALLLASSAYAGENTNTAQIRNSIIAGLAGIVANVGLPLPLSQRNNVIATFWWALCDRLPQQKVNNELLNAVKKQDINAVKLALARGAEVDVRYTRGDDYCYKGDTALIGAVVRGYAQMVQVILDAGADSTLTDKWGATALDRVPVYNNWGDKAERDRSIVVILCKKRRAAEKQAVKEALLVSEVADLVVGYLQEPEEVDYDRYRHVHLCRSAASGDIQRVENAIDLGAQINKKFISSYYYESMTPLMSSARAGQYDVVKFLLAKGAQLHLKNDDDQTALELAQARAQEIKSSGDIIKVTPVITGAQWAVEQLVGLNEVIKLLESAAADE